MDLHAKTLPGLCMKEESALLYRSDEIGYNIIMTYCDAILKGRDI